MPANVLKMLKSINNAVTFKPFYDWVIDTGLSKVKKHKDEIRKREMARWNIENENLFWSFGIFSLVFIVICSLFVLLERLDWVEAFWRQTRHTR